MRREIVTNSWEYQELLARYDLVMAELDRAQIALKRADAIVDVQDDPRWLVAGSVERDAWTPVLDSRLTDYYEARKRTR